MITEISELILTKLIASYIFQKETLFVGNKFSIVCMHI